MTLDTSGSPLSESAIEDCAANLRGLLAGALQHGDAQEAVVVFDGQSELAVGLTSAYRTCLPKARLLEFGRAPNVEILAAFEALKPGDLVVLIQSTSFRLAAFRIRIELFKRGLKVIEHPHLARMRGAEALLYFDSLAYDRDYYHQTGHGLKGFIDRAGSCVLKNGQTELAFSAGLEPAKLNIGDYTGMRNIGGQFPIGEVFTESKDLEAVNGQVEVAAFGDTSFQVNAPAAPILLTIRAGRVVQADRSTPVFEGVLADIRGAEGEIWLRELGFGLNRAFSPQRRVSDIGTYERMCGVHLSLGAKHASYNKPNIRKKSARHHVDVFPVTELVRLDDRVIFSGGAWQLDRQEHVRRWAQ